MSDPPTEPTPPPRGPARYAWFDGILEGARDPGRDADLERAAQRLRRSGVRVDLELDGGRFSVVPAAAVLRAEAVATLDPAELVDAAQALVDAAADPTAVESTLRWTAVHDDAVVETLLAPVRGELQRLSRVRPVRADDRVRAPVHLTPAAAVRAFGKRRVLLIALLMATAFAMLVWRSRIVERVLAAPTAQIQLATGPFGDRLALSVEPFWGNYILTVHRGPGYPADAAAARALEAAAVTTADRTAALAVADGRAIYAQVLDDRGELLAFGKLELRPLLAGTAATARVQLPGRIAAHRIRLALDAVTGS